MTPPTTWKGRLKPPACGVENTAVNDSTAGTHPVNTSQLKVGLEQRVLMMMVPISYSASRSMCTHVLCNEVLIIQYLCIHKYEKTILQYMPFRKL